jgi:hypothetical protein
MGQVFKFPSGELSQKDKATEDYRLARERIAVVAYAEARRLYSDPRAASAVSADDFDEAVAHCAKTLLLHTHMIADEDYRSRLHHAVVGDLPLPSESFDARNRRFVRPKRQSKV